MGVAVWGRCGSATVAETPPPSLPHAVWRGKVWIMSVAATIAEGFDPQAWVSNNLAEQVHNWSAMCGAVLKWEREHMLLRDPSEKEREDFRQALKLLRRWTRF